MRIWDRCDWIDWRIRQARTNRAMGSKKESLIFFKAQIDRLGPPPNLIPGHGTNLFCLVSLHIISWNCRYDQPLLDVAWNLLSACMVTAWSVHANHSFVLLFSSNSMVWLIESRASIISFHKLEAVGRMMRENLDCSCTAVNSRTFNLRPRPQLKLKEEEAEKI